MTQRGPLVSLLAAALLAGCGEAASLDTRTFELQYLDSEEAVRIIEPYVYRDRPKAAGLVSRAGGIITVRETRDNLERIARVLAEYDRPQPALRLTFQVIAANGAATSDPAIADVEAALRRLFRFRGYRLVAEGVMSAMEGSRIGQSLGGPGETYHVTAGVMRVRASGDSGTVQLDVRMVIAGGGELQSVVTLPIGKTAVLGNTRATPGKNTVILTVRPELVSPAP